MEKVGITIRTLTGSKSRLIRIKLHIIANIYHNFICQERCDKSEKRPTVSHFQNRQHEVLTHDPGPGQGPTRPQGMNIMNYETRRSILGSDCPRKFV